MCDTLVRDHAPSGDDAPFPRQLHPSRETPDGPRDTCARFKRDYFLKQKAKVEKYVC